MSRRNRQAVGIMAVVVLVLGLGGCYQTTLAAQAADVGGEKPHYTEIINPNGSADWTAGVVRATGIGFPPKDAANTLHAKTMARRAAHAVALRNLLETLKGVRVDSSTTVHKWMVTDDEIKVTVSGMIEGAKIVKELAMPDGSYETTVELKLGGELSNMLLPRTEAKPPRRIDSGSQLPTKKDGTTYTGLVVDARGTGAKPAMAPKILTEEGEEAYSYTYVKKTSGEKEPVAYVNDLSAASTHPRVTDHPLVIKAVRAAGSGSPDIVIRKVDAQILHGVPQHFGFLEKAQVIVILDKSS